MGCLSWCLRVYGLNNGVVHLSKVTACLQDVQGLNGHPVLMLCPSITLRRLTSPRSRSLFLQGRAGPTWAQGCNMLMLCPYDNQASDQPLSSCPLQEVQDHQSQPGI